MSSPMEVDTKSAEPLLDASDFDSRVCEAIEEHRRNDSRTFSSPQHLDYVDIGKLFKILISTRLGSYSANLDAYLSDRRDLTISLSEAYASRSFSALIKHPDMPHQFRQGHSGMTPSTSGTLGDAFRTEFLGGADKLFIDSLNRERMSYKAAGSAAISPYHWSIAIIQSSGTGKSRMVDEVANTVFTIPMNLREDLGSGYKKTFPPSDPVVRKFFEDREGCNNEEQKAYYALLLKALFDGAVEIVKQRSDWSGQDGPDLALSWAEYLREGQTERACGMNRRNYLYKAVEEAKRGAAKLRSRNKLNLDQVEGSLQLSCGLIVDTVAPRRAENTNGLFVSFDEAHVLTRTPREPEVAIEDTESAHKDVKNIREDEKGASNDLKGTPNKDQGPPDDATNTLKIQQGTSIRSPYHNLGTVTSRLTDYSAFFIFMSTNSRLDHFAPPPSHYPSGRVTDGSRLIPPFNELPFDLYRKMALTKAGALTLENMCKMEVVVGIGRPLWYTMLKANPETNMLRFAMDKLVADGVSDREKDAQTAAVAVRVGIVFDSLNTVGLDTQSRLVASHMRVVYAVPRHRAYMHTGYSCEPILAEVAGRYFSGEYHYGFAKEAPSILARTCQEGFVARGDRGGLAGRLLLTCAYEDGLDRYFANSPPPSSTPAKMLLRHHHPIPLLDFLRALFGQGKWQDTVLKAQPITDKEGAESLEKAFCESYVFFSHFSLARSSRILSSRGLASALTRGMALQAKECQVDIDAVIPVHMGSLTTRISPKTTSAINVQFKNRKTIDGCHINRSITVPNPAIPTISIVFELGVSHEGGGHVDIKRQPLQQTREGASRLHPNDRHYQIVAHGCDSGLFGAVRAESEEFFQAILRSGSVEADFPRKHSSNMEALYKLNPSFDGGLEEERDSDLFS